MKNEDWLQEFERNKDSLRYIFIKDGLEEEWHRLLELKKINQIKKMRVLFNKVLPQ